jgi:hypothetical protein
LTFFILFRPHLPLPSLISSPAVRKSKRQDIPAPGYPCAASSCILVHPRSLLHSPIPRLSQSSYCIPCFFCAAKLRMHEPSVSTHYCLFIVGMHPLSFISSLNWQHILVFRHSTCSRYIPCTYDLPYMPSSLGPSRFPTHFHSRHVRQGRSTL